MQAATGYYSLAATGALHTAGQTDLRGTGRTIQAAGVGVWTGAAGTSMGVYGAGTGIGIYNAGGGAAHNNIQPSTAMYYIIRYA
jgi:microcystin-dependent protein